MSFTTVTVLFLLIAGALVSMAILLNRGQAFEVSCGGGGTPVVTPIHNGFSAYCK